MGHLRRAASGPSFEEGEPARAEEVAPALGQAHFSGLGAVVHHPKEHDELRPGAIAVVHRVGVKAGVLAQAFEEPDDGVVIDEGGVVREQAALLGVE